MLVEVVGANLRHFACRKKDGCSANEYSNLKYSIHWSCSALVLAE
jgi:hypothetical protein